MPHLPKDVFTFSDCDSASLDFVTLLWFDPSEGHELSPLGS